MRHVFLFSLLVLSLLSARIDSDTSFAPVAVSHESRTEFTIPRARFLLHRWLEPSYQVRMLASFNWTQNDGGSTIF